MTNGTGITFQIFAEFLMKVMQTAGEPTRFKPKFNTYMNYMFLRVDSIFEFFVVVLFVGLVFFFHTNVFSTRTKDRKK